ncbi:MAG: hypothetical protein ACRDG6_01275 [Candidatus Limnocylindria bacterium]
MNDAGEPPERPPTMTELAVPVADVPRGASVSPFAIFALALLLATVTFGSSLGLLVRSDPLGAVEELPAATRAPTRAPTAAASPVRISGATGTAERLDSNLYRVTFTWTLDGARKDDTVLVRFSVGTRIISEQRGTLDATVFTSSTGKLIIATSQECSAEGWSAELVSIRALTPVGDAISRVAGVACG